MTKILTPIIDNHGDALITFNQLMERLTLSIINAEVNDLEVNLSENNVTHNATVVLTNSGEYVATLFESSDSASSLILKAAWNSVRI